MAQEKARNLDSHFRQMDKKAAVTDAQKSRKAVLDKTEKLKALRLAKEAEEAAAAALKPKKPRKASTRHKLPPFERERQD